MFLDFLIVQNITIAPETKALALIFALHKFKHYLLGNKFVFYVDYMALVYLVNKPHVLRRIVKWKLLFLEYDFTIIYKPNKTCVVVDVLGPKHVTRNQKGC
jgi:hypothetical protein